MEPGNELLKTYENIKLILKTGDVEVSDYQLIDYGLQFTVSIPDWSGMIRIYQNKKGILKIDYSQLKGGVDAIKVQTLIEGKRVISNLKNSDKNDVELGFPIIGTDESGKGDYFGPLVSAGVYVDERSAKALIACGIKDSKKLSDSKNLELAREVAKICKGHFAVVEISPQKYNELYAQFEKENKNLNTLLAWGHAKAIEEILAKVTCEIAIADQFADESFILGKLQERGKGIRLIQMHKAEQNIAVAAASVLARARFLVKLSKLSEEYSIDLPKGASHAVVENAKKFVDVHGRENLRKVAKLHFRITIKVLNK